MCLKLEVLKKIIGVAIILISMNFGVLAIALGNALFGIISMIINIIPNKKLIGYSFTEQVADLLPSLVLSICMGIIVYLISLLSMPVILTLAVQVLVGAGFYIGLSYMFKIDSFKYLLDTLKSLIRK